MNKLLCGALALASLAALAGCNSSTVSKDAATVENAAAVACPIAQALESVVLTDETIANQIAGKMVVRTGTTSTVQNVTPQLCTQIQALAATAAAATTPKN